MGLSRGRLVAIGLIVLFLFGFVFLRGPTPHIAIKAETIQSFGPFDLTNTVLTSWIVVLVLIAVVYFGTRRRDLVPRGFQNLFESVLGGFYNLVVKGRGGLRPPPPRLGRFPRPGRAGRQHICRARPRRGRAVRHGEGGGKARR